MKRMLLLIVTGALFLIGCDDTIIEPPIKVVKGTIIDSLTRIPLDSAWVGIDTLAPHRGYSDSSGYYYVPLGHSYRHSIYCGKDGYVMEETEVVFSDKVYIVVVDFELAPKSK